jgi:hypothetical protein
MLLLGVPRTGPFSFACRLGWVTETSPKTAGSVYQAME